MGLAGLPSYVKPYEQILEMGRSIAAAHPDIVTFEQIGTSSRGLDGTRSPIVGMTLGNPDAPVVGVTNLAHTQEWAPMHATMNYVAKQAAQFGSDPVTTARLERGRFAIIPAVTPGSYDYSLAHPDELVRLTSNGINVNRNTCVHTHIAGGEAGALAASEPETRALRDFFERFDLVSHMDNHSFMRAVLHPTHGPSRDFADQLAYRIGYGVRQSTAVDEAAAKIGGTIADWAAHERGVPGVTNEFGRTFEHRGAEFAQTQREVWKALDYQLSLAPDMARVGAPTIDRVRIDPSSGAVTARATMPPAWVQVLDRPAEIVTHPDAAAGSGYLLQSDRVGQQKSSALARYSGTVPQSVLRDAQDGVLWIRATSETGQRGPDQPIHLAQATAPRR